MGLGVASGAEFDTKCQLIRLVGRAPPPGSTRCLFHGNGPARSACPSPAEKTARGSDSEAKATANLMAAQQLSWVLSSKKTHPGSRRRARRVVLGEGGEGGAKSGVFYFDPKTQKPNSAARPPPPLKSRRWSPKAAANQLVPGCWVLWLAVLVCTAPFLHAGLQK